MVENGLKPATHSNKELDFGHVGKTGQSVPLPTQGVGDRSTHSRFLYVSFLTAPTPSLFPLVLKGKIFALGQDAAYNPDREGRKTQFLKLEMAPKQASGQPDMPAHFSVRPVRRPQPGLCFPQDRTFSALARKAEKKGNLLETQELCVMMLSWQKGKGIRPSPPLPERCGFSLRE